MLTEYSSLYQFQFTPLREGRRGGTQLPGLTRGISIHAPPRGATASEIAVRTLSANFNSRPSARGDECRLNFCAASAISIHAPPRGATLQRKSRTFRCAFQFTPLREGRRVCYGRIYYEIIFQFTPLREGRLSTSARAIWRNYFNSRPSARGDQIDACAEGITLFQFTPLREGRQGSKWRWAHGCISIHAPPRGATRSGNGIGTKGGIFQFTPLREGRRGDAGKETAAGVFQFTPLREGRQPVLRAQIGAP